VSEENGGTNREPGHGEKRNEKERRNKQRRGGEIAVDRKTITRTPGENPQSKPERKKSCTGEGRLEGQAESRLVRAAGEAASHPEGKKGRWKNPLKTNVRSNLEPAANGNSEKSRG